MAAIACLAVLAVLSQTDSAIPAEGFIAESVWEEAEAAAELDMAAGANKEVDVLDNIIKMKAYCLAAWDDARLLANRFAGKYASITEFVLQYGQEGGGVKRGGRKDVVSNIVTEYAELMGALRIKYPHGVNKYILDNIHKAVRHDKNGVVFVQDKMDAMGAGGDNGRKFGHLVALRKKALGLTDRPNLLTRLAAKYADYLHFKTITSKAENNADAVAATLFLKSKSSGHYTSFLHREIAKVERRMRRDFNYVAKGAFHAEKAAYESSYMKNRDAFFKHVSVQAPASVKAAKKVQATLNWTPPTLKEMKKIAAAEAKKFLEDYKKKAPSTGKLIKRMVDEAAGIKLYMTTTSITNAQSTMKPKIKFVGTAGDLVGEIRAVPGRGLSSVQHFPTSKPIGKLLSVELAGTGAGLKWNVKSLRVRVGGQKGEVVPIITSKPGTFWLKSAKKVTLKPDKKSMAKLKYNKQSCLKWHATQECDPNGKSDPDENKECSEEIDSTMSGYCMCDTGKVAKVECGHATFTCIEMCAV